MVVFRLLLVLIASNFIHSGYGQNLRMYFNLDVYVPEKKIFFQDTIYLDLKISNITKKDVPFYSKASWFLDKPAIVEAFMDSPNETYLVCNIQDAYSKQDIKPGSSFSMKLPVIIDPTFFKKGNNEMYLRYSVGKLVSKDSKHFLLKGSLVSDLFNLKIE